MDYDALALKLVPIGGHPSVVTLRKDIANMLRYAVQTATQAQREKAFPELAAARAELEAKQKQLADKQKELERSQYDFVLKQEKLAAQQVELTNLLQAFEAWNAWLEGQGGVEENGRRFEALLAAYKAYKKGLKK